VDGGERQDMDQAEVANNFFQSKLQVRTILIYSNGRYFAVNVEDHDTSTDFLDVLIASSIRKANDRDEQHRITLNQVKDNTSLMTKTPWLRHT
jgi:hypothetical protein